MDDGPDLYGAPVVRTRAAVLYSPKNLRNEEIPLEAFSGGLHVQVQLRSVGLSARDLHYYTHGSTANVEYRIQTPLVLGKEGAGQIMGIGAFVNKTWPHLQVGTRVVLEPGIPCRVCSECSNGRYNVCANLRMAGSAKSMPHISGFLRERVNWPGEMVHPLPTNVSYDVATLAEPLANIIHATRRARLQPNTSVAVFGAGVVGLLTCAYARSIGCYPILLVDSDPSRLDMAIQQEWATHIYLCPPVSSLSTTKAVNGTTSSSNGTAEQSDGAAGLAARRSLAQDILKQTRSLQGFETCFETAGHEAGLQIGIYISKRGGKVVLVGGMSQSGQYLPLSQAMAKEVDLVPVQGYMNTFPVALSCLAAGTLGNVKALLTHRVPLERAESGFRWMLAASNEQSNPVIKVIVGDAPPVIQ